MIEFLPIDRALLTHVEAAVYLLLAEDGEKPEAARRAMNLLVDQGKIKPCLVGGKRRYSRQELDRFIADTTEGYQ